MITAERYHDFSCGHRVVGHEGKCALLHGHNYRVHFICAADALDAVGRVIDFSIIKAKLCTWLEVHYDHRFLAWEDDALMIALQEAAIGSGSCVDAFRMFHNSVVWVRFNPTAENIALHLLNVVGPKELEGTGVRLTEVRIEETRKCGARAWISAS